MTSQVWRDSESPGEHWIEDTAVQAPVSSVSLCSFWKGKSLTLSFLFHGRRVMMVVLPEVKDGKELDQAFLTRRYFSAKGTLCHVLTRSVVITGLRRCNQQKESKVHGGC